MNIYYIPFIILLGWLAGVIVNYFSDTLPKTRRLSKPTCNYCQSKQNLINYIIWPRKCSSCRRNRSVRVWIIEALFILGSIWLWLSPTNRIGFFASLALWIYFGVVTIIDIEHRVILHPVSFVGAMICAAIGVWLHNPLATLLGGIAGFTIMLLLFYFGQVIIKLLGRIRGQTIEEDALGFGDVILGGVIGLLLGWPGILAGVFFTILIGGLISLLYMIIKISLKQYKSDMVLPYGPFLVASAIFLIYFRQMI